MIDFALNKDVRDELLKDFQLFALYITKYGTYDWEIDPLHNPSLVANTKKQEVLRLEDLRKSIEKAKVFFDSAVEEQKKLEYDI